MHNREGPETESAELSRLDLAAIAPLVAVIVALGVYPNFVTHRSEAGTVSKIRGAQAAAGIAPGTEANHETIPPETGP
jgi:NADH:ubiquinone oxidoreductase subunit 4 (subunit M)